jgi:alpha-tubulin suppressor-like RCC1 family protein
MSVIHSRPRVARAPALAILGLFVFTLLVVGACKDATQVRLIVRTNVEYRADNQLAIWASSRPDSADAPLAQSADPWLSDGNVGDLVVTPPGRKDGELWLRVVMGVGRAAQTCSDTDAKGCIVAKRKLRFVPRAGLRVPVVIHLACEGVVCGEESTCNYLGKCVSAVVDPEACGAADGCVLPGDETVVAVTPRDAGGEPSVPDVGADVFSDAASDASIDAVAVFPKQGPFVSAGTRHTCARLANNQVKCWGQNDNGQLGVGDVQDRGDQPGEVGANLPAVDFGPGRFAISLNRGYGHTCAQLDNNEVKCWGRNTSGELGVGDAQNRGDQPGEMGTNLPAVNFGPGRTAVEVAAGHSHTCARLDNGQLKCWGFNGYGQLGLGDLDNRGDQPGEMAALPAINLGPGRTALSVIAGAYHTCALLDNGQAKCWGENASGKLGMGDTENRGDQPGEMDVLPTLDLGPGRIAQLAPAVLHTCARFDTGQVKCWGNNDYGPLGLGDRSHRGDNPGELGALLQPVDLGPGRTAVSIESGHWYTCALLDNGLLKCWGRNASGVFGLGDSVNRGDDPGEMGVNLPGVDVGPGRSILQWSGGSSHICARLDNGAIKCWGWNDTGQLGLGDLLDRGDQPGEMGATLPFVPLP